MTNNTKTSKTLSYLNSLLKHNESIECLQESIKEQFGVTMKPYTKDGVTLYTLNYSQIDSPRFHEIADECRGLILEIVDGEFVVTSRSFDRFYNYEELINANTPELGKKVLDAFNEYPNHIKIYEKLDGSLIKLYHHKKLGWQFSTRSVPFAEQCDVKSIDDDLTFQDLINRFDFSMNTKGYEHLTFIFELCCSENKVVTTYERERFVLLAIRNNENGKYLNSSEMERISKHLRVETPKTLAWTNFEDLLKTVKDLPNLEEGFILVNERTHDRIKIKSPVYVHAHHLRTNGPMTVKKAFNSYGEREEILAYFPELEEWYNLIEYGTEQFKVDVKETVKKFYKENIKDFAIELNKQEIQEPLKGAAIQTLRGKSINEIWERLFDCNKIDYIKSIQDKFKESE